MSEVREVKSTTTNSKNKDPKDGSSFCPPFYNLQLLQLVEINCERCNYWYSTTCMFLVQITGFNVFGALITF